MKRTKLRNALIASGLAGAMLLGISPASAQMGGWGMGPGMMEGPGYEQRHDRTAPPEAERGPSRGYGYGYGYGPGYGMGPGMMGGYGPAYGMGPGMMGGYGPGYGMGPGMMGGYGYGMGPGMMWGYGPGYGMGPGMMGQMMGGYGYGMGPGMMGGYGPGYGMGPGMMGGYGAPYYPDLSAEQRKKLDAIGEESARKQWELAGKMRDESLKLNDLAAADKRDRAAIVNQYKKLQELRLQRFQARLDAQDRIDGVLTKEQRERVRRFGSW